MKRKCLNQACTRVPCRDEVSRPSRCAGASRALTPYRLHGQRNIRLLDSKKWLFCPRSETCVLSGGHSLQLGLGLIVWIELPLVSGDSESQVHQCASSGTTSHLGRFSFRPETVIELLHDGIVACGRKRGQSARGASSSIAALSNTRARMHTRS